MKRKWNERTAETDRQSTGLLHTSPLSAFCPSVNESVNQSFISQSHTKHTTIAVQVSPDRNSSPQQQRLVDWFDSFPTVSSFQFSRVFIVSFRNRLERHGSSYLQSSSTSSNRDRATERQSRDSLPSLVLRLFVG